MKILSHEIPKKERKQVKKVFNQKSGKVGRKPTYNWPELAPQVEGMQPNQAAKKIGCSRESVIYAHNRGWINLAEF